MTKVKGKKGRPSNKLNKLIEIKNKVSQKDTKDKIDRLIKHLEDRKYNDINRGIQFLRDNENKYIKANEYTKKKYLNYRIVWAEDK
jgi:hypothetical protein